MVKKTKQKMIKTTITLPVNLMTQLKYYAVSQNLNMSEIIRASIQEKLGIKKNTNRSLLDLVGSIKPNKKYTLVSRDKIYDEHLKQKIGF